MSDTFVVVGLGFWPCPEPETDRREWQWVYAAAPDLTLEIHEDMVHSPHLRKSISLSYDDIADHVDAPASVLATAVVHGMAPNTYKRLRYVVDVSLAARNLRTSKDETEFERFVSKRKHRRYAHAALEIAGRLLNEPACLRIAQSIGFRSDRIRAKMGHWLIGGTMREAVDLDRPLLRLSHRLMRQVLQTPS